ncbi:unnamed protein product [Trichobilharzia regenti]|nr:unnamed protein product [Trichobilharzia regenti]
MIFRGVVDCIMRQTVGKEERGVRRTTDCKTLQDLDFSADMSRKLEDLRAKTNKLAEEAGSEDSNAGEHREDGGGEDNQPTAASTTTTNQH